MLARALTLAVSDIEALLGDVQNLADGLPELL